MTEEGNLPHLSQLDSISQIPIYLVSPELAKEWLDTRFADRERNLLRDRVESFRRDMVAGEWKPDGTPIRFDQETGNLVDGQHRLSAMVAAEVTLPLPVWGISMDTHRVVDTGRPRSLKDVLKMNGYVADKVAAGIINRLLSYTHGTTGNHYRPTHSEGVSFAVENKDALTRACAVAQRVASNGTLPASPSAIGAAFFLADERSPEQAEEFFDQVVSGMNLQEGSPALALRNRFLLNVNRHGVRLHANDVFFFTIVAWNAFRKGQPLQRVTTPKGGFTKNNRPTPL